MLSSQTGHWPCLYLFCWDNGESCLNPREMLHPTTWLRSVENTGITVSKLQFNPLLPTKRMQFTRKWTPCQRWPELWSRQTPAPVSWKLPPGSIFVSGGRALEFEIHAGREGPPSTLGKHQVAKCKFFKIHSKAQKTPKGGRTLADFSVGSQFYKWPFDFQRDVAR